MPRDSIFLCFCLKEYVSRRSKKMPSMTFLHFLQLRLPSFTIRGCLSKKFVLIVISKKCFRWFHLVFIKLVVCTDAIIIIFIFKQRLQQPFFCFFKLSLIYFGKQKHLLFFALLTILFRSDVSGSCVQSFKYITVNKVNASLRF